MNVHRIAALACCLALTLSVVGCDGGRKDALKSQNHMRMIAMGINLYADANNGKLPDNLDQILPFVENDASVFTNPRTGAKPGYEYVKPGEKMSEVSNPSATVIVYELKDGKRDPAGAVAFLDGHTGTAP